MNSVNDQLFGVENNGVWSRAMLIAIRAKNKIAFIDGLICDLLSVMILCMCGSDATRCLFRGS